MRYFFNVSYKGTGYHGWQKQKNVLSVQEVIEEHLSTMFRRNIQIVGSGRTDTGVHARQQCFHADFSNPVNPDVLINRMNSYLPDDTSIQSIFPVKEGAHARFDAMERSYEYLLIFKKDPFLHDYAYRFSGDLNVDNMNEGARILKSFQNFQSFSRVKTDVMSFNCEIHRAEWKEMNNGLIFHITSNRFLRGMVRAIVGTLLDIGQGRRNPEDIKSIIESKDRKSAGRTVPAKGLYLTKVKYPSQIFIKNK